MANNKNDQKNNVKRTEKVRQNAEMLKQLEVEKHNKMMRIFPIVGGSIMILTILLFLLRWAGIYNTTIVGYEVEFSGFECLRAKLTNSYSATEGVGDMSIPFYYYAKEYCEKLGNFTAIAFVVCIINVALQLVTIFSKKHILNAAAAVTSLASFILLIVCFSTALGMKDAKILSIYCSGNPACSIRSLAILPAITALLSFLASSAGTVAAVVTKNKLS